ncbi:MAG: hypothetical protein HKN84_14750 [Gammaproteobacteria bacterium]|nr:hypothetical protein [Gammaproteobacteria bacterium]
MRATLVAVVCNFAIPIGYMPAALADGGPVQLCPSGWPSGAMPGHGGHDGHHGGGHDGYDGHSSGDEAWEHCAFGAASSSPALVSDHEISIARFSDVPDGYLEPQPLARRDVLAFRSRAPPLTTPLTH